VESREGKICVGGARLVNMLVITKSGAEIMDFFSREEISPAARSKIRLGPELCCFFLRRFVFSHLTKRC